MTPKPDARIIPTQDEFDSWTLHPVTKFVAEAYRLGAEKQKAAWEAYFDKPMIPADISALRLELKTREDAYRAFLETTLDDYLAIIEGAQPGGQIRPPQPLPAKGPVRRRTVYSRA